MEAERRFTPNQLLGHTGEQLLRLSQSAEWRGDVTASRQWLRRALANAELARDADLMARIAVQRSLPIDWLAGDVEILGVLERAASLPLSADASVMVDAVRGMAEMRRPVGELDGPQFAWVTRPQIAQPITEDALARSGGASPRARATALLAWRSTHRAPRHLVRRLKVSSELLDLAEQEDLPGHLIEAAVFHVVDSIEAGSRRGLERGLSLAEWAADRSGNPSVKWRASAVAAGVALVDDDDERAQHHLVEGAEFGRREDSAGWHSADLVFQAERLLDRLDAAAYSLLAVFEQSGIEVNPLAKAMFALGAAGTGRASDAQRYIRAVIDGLDEEASMLLLLTRATHAAIVLHDRPLLDELSQRMALWADAVAIDSNGWWCDGPVSLWLAAAAHELGRERDADAFLERAVLRATALGDRRSMRRADDLAAQIEAQALALQYW
jgi:hypothetical protein